MKDELSELDLKRTEIGFLERSLKICDNCKACRYYALCRGGCQRQRELNAQTGRYLNYLCESYRIYFDYYYETILKIAYQLPLNFI